MYTSVKWAERIVIIPYAFTAREPHWEATWRQWKYWERWLGWWQWQKWPVPRVALAGRLGRCPFSPWQPGGPASVGRLVLICIFPNSHWLTFVMTVLLNGLRPNFIYCTSFSTVASTIALLVSGGQNLTQTDQRCVPEHSKGASQEMKSGTISRLKAIIFSGFYMPLYSSVCCSGADLVFWSLVVFFFPFALLD